MEGWLWSAFLLHPYPWYQGTVKDLNEFRKWFLHGASNCPSPAQYGKASERLSEDKKKRRSIIVTPRLRLKDEMNWEVIYSKQHSCRCKELKVIEETKSRMGSKGWD